MKSRKKMDTHFLDQNAVKKFRKLDDESRFSSGSSNPNVFNMAPSSSSDEVEKND